MTVKRGRNFLMTPGPTPIPERILNAMHRQAIDFSGPEFQALARACLEDIRPIFKTRSPVFVYTASGHGAWEAALANTLSPGDRVLVPETGNFSFAWKDMAEALGILVDELPGDWRHAVDPAEVEARLAADRGHEIKAVLLVHTDTASAITSDVPALRAAIDRAGHPALLMVDTVASLVTTDFRMDEWRVDVAVGASQKGLMLPPGLGFTAASEKALRAGQAATMPRRYWDWRERAIEHHYKWFCGTAPEHLIFGLREAIDMVLEEGLEAAFARHARLAEAAGRARQFDHHDPDARGLRQRRAPPGLPRALRRGPGRRPGPPAGPGLPDRPHGRHQRADDPGGAGQRRGGTGDLRPAPRQKWGHRSDRLPGGRDALSAGTFLGKQVHAQQ
jgi:alanine-glyoxylate transaminase/serine-glyoxylate transaminase/serine-pyruvate transaminase